PPHPPIYTLFPYTTLFRSRLAQVGEPEAAGTVEDEIVRAAQLPSIARVVERLELAALGIDDLNAAGLVIVGLGDREGLARADHRSEEHTSELQSRFDLVCR